MDPLWALDVATSPYVYGGNSPVVNIDPSGLSQINVHTSPVGDNPLDPTPGGGKSGGGGISGANPPRNNGGNGGIPRSDWRGPGRNGQGGGIGPTGTSGAPQNGESLGDAPRETVLVEDIKPTFVEQLEGRLHLELYEAFDHSQSSGTYSYMGMPGLSKAELYVHILIDKTVEQLGIKDLFALAGVGLGANVVPTRAKFFGSTQNTSVLSSLLSRLNINLPFKLPTLTGFPGIGQGMRVATTKNLGRVVARAVPVLGWMTFAYDAVMITYHTQIEFNRITSE